MPHSRRLTPEAPQDDQDESSSASRNSNTSPGNNGDANPQLAGNRRDENSISFRHFLQPQSDVVPTRTRTSRGASSGSVDLVDGVSSMALPDFVQDHLVTEGGACAGASSSFSSDVQGAGSMLAAAGCPLDFSTDAAAGGAGEFSASQCSSSYLQKKNRRQQESNNSVSGKGANCSQATAAMSLPDFLSDMQCSTNLTDGTLNPAATSALNGSVGSGGSSAMRSSGAGRSVESLSQEVERLRREVAEKNRRIGQLESEMTRQRSESSMFEAAYLNSEQGLQAANRRALAGETRIAELSEELRFLKHQFSSRLGSRDSSNAAGVHPDSSRIPQRNTNGHSSWTGNPNQVLDITYSAEILAGELLEQLQSLKRVALNQSKEDSNEHPVGSSHGKGRKSKDESKSSKK